MLGLLVLLAYWYSVHPMDFARGYTEDWCHPEQTRQLDRREGVDADRRTDFHTPSFAHPKASLCRSCPGASRFPWLGAYFWKLNPATFRFSGYSSGWSLLVSYFGVGVILRKMRLGPIAAWGVALGAVLFHVPRHFKIWHHYEHLLQHWVYWSFFLDAWIWQRFCRERRWSWSLEAWRAGSFCCGMMTTAGYFWGPMILLWLLVRLAMGGVWLAAAPRSRRLRGCG